jgi:hypothetical protein
MFRVDLGGEGGIPGILNQQPLEAAGPNWFSVSRKTLVELIRDGHQFLICPNTALALPDGCVDIVYTSGVPVDKMTVMGPEVQSSEIRRILKSGGVWIRDGFLYFTKP